MAAPSWSTTTLPVYSSTDVPVEVRASLATLSTWIGTIVMNASETRTLLDLPSLPALGAQTEAGSAGAKLQQLITSAPFHAHPFREPLTGHNYVRARWKDLQTGTFLTPDPVGNRDSVNHYSFCRNNPVNCRDPRGLFGEDFHYYLTLYLAVRAGFGLAEALIIAHEAQAPDVDERSPVISGARMMQHPNPVVREREARELAEWHFPKKDPYGGAVQPGSSIAASRSLRALSTGDLRLLGAGFHPLQDSWAHRGYPSLHGNAGHSKERGGVLSKETDKTYTYPYESLSAASATYCFLLEFRRKWRNGGPLGPSWEQISDEIEEYLLLENNSSKDFWLIIRLARITKLKEWQLYGRLEYHWSGSGPNWVEPYYMQSLEPWMQPYIPFREEPR
jgi:RHS repeat-associated protein